MPDDQLILTPPPLLSNIFHRDIFDGDATEEIRLHTTSSCHQMLSATDYVQPYRAENNHLFQAHSNHVFLCCAAVSMKSMVCSFTIYKFSVALMQLKAI